MENGRSYDEVVDKAVEVVNSGITQRPDFDIDSLGEIKVCGAFCALLQISDKRSPFLASAV